MKYDPEKTHLYGIKNTMIWRKLFLFSEQIERMYVKKLLITKLKKMVQSVRIFRSQNRSVRKEKKPKVQSNKCLKNFLNFPFAKQPRHSPFHQHLCVIYFMKIYSTNRTSCRPITSFFFIFSDESYFYLTLPKTN